MRVAWSLVVVVIANDAPLRLRLGPVVGRSFEVLVEVAGFDAAVPQVLRQHGRVAVDGAGVTRRLPTVRLNR